MQRALEGVRQRGAAGDRSLRQPLGQLVADLVPQPQVGDVIPGGVVVDGHPGDLDDARLDRVHQGEVADHPREEVALGIAGALEEVRRRGQVVHGLDPELARNVLKAGEPHAGVPVAVAGLGAVLPLERVLGVGCVLERSRTPAVAVVGLVVEDHEPSLTATGEAAQHPRDHLVGGLDEGVLAAAPGEQRLGVAGQALALLRGAQQEGVEVRDDDVGLAQVTPQVGGHEVALLVVVLVI